MYLQQTWLSGRFSGRKKVYWIATQESDLYKASYFDFYRIWWFLFDSGSMLNFYYLHYGIGSNPITWSEHMHFYTYQLPEAG